MKIFMGVNENTFIIVNNKKTTTGCFAFSMIPGHIRIGYRHNDGYAYDKHDDDNYDFVKIEKKYYYCRYSNDKDEIAIVCIEEEEYDYLCKFGKPTTVEINQRKD